MSQTILRQLAAMLGLMLTLMAPRPGRAAEPVLTILFTGNTYGTIAPCPS